MSKPLKQAEQFKTIDELNAWLSLRSNDQYTFEVLATPYNNSVHPVVYTVIYWEQSLTITQSQEETTHGN